MKRYILFLPCLFLLGCGTVSPNFTQAHQISFGTDGIQDAGVKGQVYNSKSPQKTHEILLQTSDRDEFNNDIIKYGDLFNPPLSKDFGIVPFGDKYAFRNDALIDFYVMKKLEGLDLGKTILNK